MRWTPERMDQLERAARDGRRVAVTRRGTEQVVVALRMTQVGSSEGFVGRVPMTGEEIVFALNSIEHLHVLG